VRESIGNEIFLLHLHYVLRRLCHPHSMFYEPHKLLRLAFRVLLVIVDYQAREPNSVSALTDIKSEILAILSLIGDVRDIFQYGTTNDYQ
jgi:hypothetical protein